MIGLCGAGMSAVARLLQQVGYTVTGSDAGFYPPVSDYITKLGLTCTVGHRAENIPPNPDLIVIGKHAKLVPETNEEVAAAHAQYKDHVCSFPEILANLTADRQRMVVAGSYGKSSMTSLITWCLAEAGTAPGWFIGAIPKGFAHSSDIGEDGPFIFEGDEYPSANWDTRAKFEHYEPHTVLLTSATHDHVNIYPTLEDYHKPFAALLSGLAKRKGTLIACTDETNAAAFYEVYPGPKEAYGLDHQQAFTASNIVLGDPSRNTPTQFDLHIRGDVLKGFTTTQMGRHAIENICGAAAYLLGQNLISVEAFRDAVARFDGLERRLDRKAPNSALMIYEGFGSSYEKARAAISAVRAHFPQRRLVVMFEPHTFTWRNRAALGLYETVFADTETVWLFAPPAHGATSHDQLSLDEIVAGVRAHHPDVRPFIRDESTSILNDLHPEKDVLLILSSGSFDGALAPLLETAAEAYPAPIAATG